MEITSNNFVQNAFVALQDIGLRTAITNATNKSVPGRLTSWAELTDWRALRQQARGARLRALHSLPDVLELFERNITARGAHVLWATDGDECNQLVLDIARKHNVRTIVKGKSMATEESGLNHTLEAAGLFPQETDLGEFIIQLAGETPSHIVGPSLHKTQDQVHELFERHLNKKIPNDAKALAMEARYFLRDRFIRADMGITGANFAIAETGTMCLVTNEGNGRMSSSFPRVHVVVMGFEKVIETVEDFCTLVQMLVRSDAGQRLTSYVHMMSGPARPDDPDGPEEMYVILLDNRRSHIYASGDQYAESLACIRCGSCLNICPVYRRVGGHAYGWVYSGPIGAVISPLMVGLENAAPLPHASSLCGACKDACPVDIDLPRMLLNLRRDLVDEGHADPTITMGIKGWAVAMQSPKLYELGGKAASGATQIAANGDESLHNLPGPLGNWTRNRDFPPFAKKSFRQLWRDHQKEQKGL